ncbi:MAG: hypothetical protein AAF391_03725 [Bacteroidota bacterium]
MSENNKSTSFLKVLLSAGLLSFISAMFGIVYNSYQDRQLERIKFRNSIIEKVISLPTRLEKEKYLSEVIAVGALDTSGMSKNSMLYSGSYVEGKYAAIRDQKLERGIVGAIAQFIGKRNRIPISFEELRSTIDMNNIMELASCDIYYDAFDNNSKFILRFCGADRVTYTNDDRQYRKIGTTIETKKGQDPWRVYLQL